MQPFRASRDWPPGCTRIVGRHLPGDVVGLRIRLYMQAHSVSSSRLAPRCTRRCWIRSGPHPSLRAVCSDPTVLSPAA